MLRNGVLLTRLHYGRGLRKSINALTSLSREFPCCRRVLIGEKVLLLCGLMAAEGIVARGVSIARYQRLRAGESGLTSDIGAD